MGLLLLHVGGSGVGGVRCRGRRVVVVVDHLYVVLVRGLGEVVHVLDGLLEVLGEFIVVLLVLVSLELGRCWGLGGARQDGGSDARVGS